MHRTSLMLCTFIWRTPILQTMNWGKIVGLWVSIAVVTELEKVNYNSLVCGVFIFFVHWSVTIRLISKSYITITVTQISAELIMFEYILYHFTCFATKRVKGVSGCQSIKLFYLQNCNFGCPLCPHVRIF